MINFLLAVSMFSIKSFAEPIISQGKVTFSGAVVEMTCGVNNSKLHCPGDKSNTNPNKNIYTLAYDVNKGTPTSRALLKKNIKNISYYTLKNKEYLTIEYL